MKILKLKEYRNSFRMTQSEISQLLNVSQSYYSRLEKGKNFPDALQILELCKIFKCTPNDLFGIKGVSKIVHSSYREEK